MSATRRDQQKAKVVQAEREPKPNNQNQGGQLLQIEMECTARK